MTKLVARKNLNQTAGHVRKLQSLCVFTLCLSRGLLTVCKVPHLNSSIATLTLACVATSFLVCFSVFERHPRAKSNEKTLQVNKVNNGGGGEEKREKPPAFNSLRIFKTPLPLLVCYTAVFSLVTQRSSPQTAVCGEERCVATLKTAV